MWESGGRTGVVCLDFNEQESDTGAVGGYSDEWDGSLIGIRL